MKKHILACAITTGLLATMLPAASQTQVVETRAQAGYLIYKVMTGKESGLGQAMFQGAGAAGGGLLGLTLGKMGGAALAAKSGGLIGAKVGTFCGGFVGLIVGAAAGAA